MILFYPILSNNNRVSFKFKKKKLFRDSLNDNLKQKVSYLSTFICKLKQNNAYY